MFGKLLIANRGEISCRIMRTCRRLGIRTVAVYSDADRDALHVRLADEAVRLGPAPARASYLRADRIVAAAKTTGAEAIHPGYGFLAEKLELVRACEAGGIVFVGPSATAIEAMGDKIRSKAIARAAGVPGVPGYDGERQSVDALRDAALAIGLPVMIKASAGGGGKGIRRVACAADLTAAIEIARREAESAFGEGRLLIERLIQPARHIEVQVAGDRHGNVVHLFERDCSVQRANQKLLEEAPAPGLSTQTRRSLHAHATALAGAIRYDNLGTVEFLVEAETGEACFLEMNTRLQVEHPVTEAITGLDLVEWQLRIAAGQTLPLAQHQIRCTGHAVEARLTAERADHEFRPDVGTIKLWRPPSGLRIDSGVEAGSTIGLHYDSLLAKVIAHAPERQTAVAALADGLERMVVLGPSTIRPFLVDALLRSPAFMRGAVTTGFIDESLPGGWQRSIAETRLVHAIAALIWLQNKRFGQLHSPWQTLRAFRVLAPAGRPATTHLFVRDGDAETGRVKVTNLSNDESRVTIDDTVLDIALAAAGDDVFTVSSGGVTRHAHAVVDERGVCLHFASAEGRFEVAPAVDAEAATQAGSASTGSGDLVAAMPGLVTAIHVAVGDEVAAGDTIAVLESMKLFMELKAAAAGRVTRIGAAPGQTVGAGDLLVAIAPLDTVEPPAAAAP